MDLISFGLREAMKAGHQGALARVTKSGLIAVGQEVEISGQLSAVSRQLISDS
jgi:hypothetical protein